ncbi:MAG TPA: BMP family ABC transporter substrate-binding protein, partial [Streptosporangiaceae bacterium]
MKKTLAASAVLTVAGLLAAACGSSTSNSSGSSSASAKASSTASASTAGKFLGCMVTDTGGIDDRSFNASAYTGIKDAATAGGVTPKYLQSQQASDYPNNINAFIQQKCGIIVTVGFLMGDATEKAANANHDQKFAIVDF